MVPKIKQLTSTLTFKMIIIMMIIIQMQNIEITVVWLTVPSAKVAMLHGRH